MVLFRQVVIDEQNYDDYGSSRKQVHLSHGYGCSVRSRLNENVENYQALFEEHAHKQNRMGGFTRLLRPKKIITKIVGVIYKTLRIYR